MATSKKQLPGLPCVLERTDCIKAMGQMKKASVPLIAADPPYNIGKAYENYDDKKPHDEFMEWTQNWLCRACDLLHPHGSLFIFAPDEWVSEVDVFCRQHLRLCWQGTIIWYYTFGVACQGRYSRSHTQILWFTRHSTKFTFNRDAIAVPSNRQLVYNDKRANPKGKVPDNTWMLTQQAMANCFGPDEDTWLVSRVCGTFKEREKHSSNQIPLPIMERIVLGHSNPGDTVLDPFCGTGTTGVAAVMHGRNFIGYDVSDTCIKQSSVRIAKAHGELVARTPRRSAQIP